MKVGIVQPLNKDSAIRLTEKALRSGASLVLLPEKWVQHLDEAPLEEFKELAKKYTAVIIPGAFEDGVSVIAPIIWNDGGVKGIAKKIHLFKSEKGRLLGGDRTIVFTYGGIKFGVAICYDVDFPEVVKAQAIKGMEVLLVPSKVKAEGMDIWREFLKVRVLENRIAIVNANALQPPEFPGMSSILVPEKQNELIVPRIIGELPNGKEDFIVVDIDPLLYLKVREERLKEYVNFDVVEL